MRRPSWLAGGVGYVKLGLSCLVNGDGRGDWVGNVCGLSVYWAPYVLNSANESGNGEFTNACRSGFTVCCDGYRSSRVMSCNCSAGCSCNRLAV